MGGCTWAERDQYTNHEGEMLDIQSTTRGFNRNIDWESDAPTIDRRFRKNTKVDTNNRDKWDFQPKIKTISKQRGCFGNYAPMNSGLDEYKDRPREQVKIKNIQRRKHFIFREEEIIAAKVSSSIN